MSLFFGPLLIEESLFLAAIVACFLLGILSVRGWLIVQAFEDVLRIEMNRTEALRGDICFAIDLLSFVLLKVLLTEALDREGLNAVIALV